MTDEAKKAFDNVNKGDILVGYNSRSIMSHKFYEVVGKTKCCVKLQELGRIHSKGTMAKLPVRPDVTKKEGSVITRRVMGSGFVMADGEYSAMISLNWKYDPSDDINDCLLD